MKTRLVTIAKYAAYPFFYLFCLGLFGYLTFPWDRLKDRVIAEFDRAQQKRSGPPQRLEIDSLDSYWFTGLKVKGARLIMPPSSDASSFSGFPPSDAKADPPKPSVIEIDEAHARVNILPLLIGRVRVNFWAVVFGGEVEGVLPVGKSAGGMQLALSNIDLSLVDPLTGMLGLPLHGTLAAKLDLDAPEGKFNKANGSLEVTGKDVSVGDGKTKIQGLIALPEAKLGELSLSAEAKDGVLKITKMSANGSDLELAGDGKVSMREPWDLSTADLFVRFKFTDAYRNKSDLTKSLLGAPGSSLPGLIEMQQPKMKRAKREDGFYGFHAYGQLKRMRFDPQAAGDASGTTSRSRGSSGGVNLPLGESQAGKPPGISTEDEPTPPPPGGAMVAPKARAGGDAPPPE